MPKGLTQRCPQIVDHIAEGVVVARMDQAIIGGAQGEVVADIVERRLRRQRQRLERVGERSIRSRYPRGGTLGRRDSPAGADPPGRSRILRNTYGQ